MLFLAPTVAQDLSALHRFDGPQRESLEEFLARARAKQAEIFARLGAELEALVKRIEAMNLPPARQAREDMIVECIALGAEATPLFVRWLDAGEAALEKERYRAGLIAVALSRMDTRAATAELLALVAKGSNDARVLAAKVLETTPEPERVRPELVVAFKNSEGQLRAAVLRTLLRLASNDSQLIDQVLTGDDEALRGVALGVLTDAKDAAAEEKVQRLLADPVRGPAHAQQILAYYQALPELVESAELKDLLGLAGNSQVPAATREAIIESLPRFVPNTSNDLKRALEPIMNGADLKLATAAQVVLAKLGDRVVKRELLRQFDEMVESMPKWSQAYARRADMLRKVGDYREAEKDYKTALNLGKTEANPQPDTYIGLARCAALQGKFKDAASWLQQAPIQLSQLRLLANDPDFAKLRASKFGDVFPKE